MNSRLTRDSVQHLAYDTGQRHPYIMEDGAVVVGIVGDEDCLGQTRQRRKK